MKTRCRFTLSLCLLLVTACSLGRPVRTPQYDGDRYLINYAELESTKQAALYDAIQQVRPFWLTRSEAGVAVYFNDQLVGGLGSLRRISVHLTEQARYMSATEAHARFGSTNGVRPAILVRTRH